MNECRQLTSVGQIIPRSTCCLMFLHRGAFQARVHKNVILSLAKVMLYPECVCVCHSHTDHILNLLSRVTLSLFTTLAVIMNLLLILILSGSNLCKRLRLLGTQNQALFAALMCQHAYILKHHRSVDNEVTHAVWPFA